MAWIRDAEYASDQDAREADGPNPDAPAAEPDPTEDNIRSLMRMGNNSTMPVAHWYDRIYDILTTPPDMETGYAERSGRLEAVAGMLLGRVQVLEALLAAQERAR